MQTSLSKDHFADSWVGAHLRTILIYFLFTFLFISTSLGQNLVGAELYYDNLDQSNVQVVLKKYLDCVETPVVKQEIVSIHDTNLKSLHSKIELTLQSNQKLESEEKYTCLGNKACMTELVYSAKVELSISTEGYDLTWGYGYLDASVINLSMIERQGISLTTHIDNPWDAPSNHAPSFEKVPFYNFCMDQENIEIKGKDKDQDLIKIEMAAMRSNLSKMERDYYHDARIKKSVSRNGMDGTLLTQCPPFHPLKIEPNFSNHQPFGGSEPTYLPKEGLLQVQPEMAGKYIYSMSISDFREGKKLTEHPAFFILEVRDAPFE